MTEPRHRLLAIVSGVVQGVNYRGYACRCAYQLGLCGWIRNLPNGTVECVVEGSEDIIRKFVDCLWQGSPASRVQDVALEWFPASGEFHNFVVRYM